MPESTNSTVHWAPPTCTPENWSNESALAVLVALAIGCLAHPRGSLTFNKSGRIWRLSPHLGLVEALNLIFKLLIGLVRCSSLRVACVTLLAIRYGNSWTWPEYTACQEAWEKQQAKKEGRSITGGKTSGDSIEISAMSGARGPHTVDEDDIPSVGRSATIEAEEGRANVDLHRRTNRAAGPHDETENIIENRDGNSTENAPQASPDAIFLVQLREAERYEKGLVFRILVWIPMLFSLLKILSGTGGWTIWGPKVCGSMFFYSWFVTELITIAASWRQLSEKQREAALKLGRLWRKSLEVFELRHTKTKLNTELRSLWARQHQLDTVRREKIRHKWWESQHETMKSVAEFLAIEASQRQQSKERDDNFSKRYELKEEEKETFETALIDPRNLFLLWELKGPFLLGRICCTILLGFNAWPLVAKTASMYFIPYWRYYTWVDSFLWRPDWSDSRKLWMSPVEISILYPFVVVPLILYAVVYFVLVYSVVSPWALHVFNILCCGIPGVILRRGAGTRSTKLFDMDGLVPGYLALGQAILTILRFTRVLNDYASYDCSTTTRASWYDWTL